MKIQFRVMVAVTMLFSVTAIASAQTASGDAKANPPPQQQQRQQTTVNLTPLTLDQVLPVLRQGVADHVIVTGVIDISDMSGSETWAANKFEFRPGARIKIGARALTLAVEELVAPADAVIIYTFDDGEVGPKPTRARNGANGVTPSGDGRNGANGEDGANGIRGVDGKDGGLVILTIQRWLAQPVAVSLHGQNGGPGGDGGNGGNGDSGNRGRRASDGAGTCRSGGGDGGDGGRGGRGGMAGQGGRAGDGGLLNAKIAVIDDMLEIEQRIVLLGDPATHGVNGARGSGGRGAGGGGGGRGSTFCRGGRGGSRGADGGNGRILQPHHPATGAPPSTI